MTKKNPTIERFVIKRGSHVFRLTDEEVEAVVKLMSHTNLKKTCGLMTRTFVKDMGLLDGGDAKQIKRFMNEAMPEDERDILAKIYANRDDDMIAPYDLWIAILSEHMLMRNSPMCKFMHKTIFEHTDPHLRAMIMANRHDNPDGKNNFNDVLAGMSAKQLISIWKNHNFIREI